MAIKLTKTKKGRTRYLVGPALSHVLDWQKEFFLIRKLINEETHLQLVGDKTEFQIVDGAIHPMMEVIGTPVKSGPIAWSLFDLDEREVNVLKLDSDFTEVSPDEIQEQARKVMQAMNARGESLFPVYHMVIFNGKIELHFFGQKDYSQNLL